MQRVITTRADLRRAAGNSIILGFAGVTLGPELKELLREVHPLGVILFARNIESPDQVAELNAEIKSFARTPIMISVDQEGGRIRRLGPPATPWPPMQRLGDIDDLALTEKVGHCLAREVRAMGFDLTYAPVFDVHTNPNNPVIGDRAFSADAQTVARHATAFTKGCQSAGVAACGKHFPGHGDTDVDSHVDLPIITNDLAQLEQREWVPFAAAARAGVGAMMTAHVVVPCIDETAPATLSAKVLQKLRRTVNFAGVIISDDLEMQAVAKYDDPGPLAVKAINAGVDVLLLCHRPEAILAAYRDIVVATEQQNITPETIITHEKRVLSWRQRFCAPPAAVQQRAALVRSVVGCAEHQDVLSVLNAARPSEDPVPPPYPSSRATVSARNGSSIS